MLKKLQFSSIEFMQCDQGFRISVHYTALQTTWHTVSGS